VAAAGGGAAAAAASSTPRRIVALRRSGGQRQAPSPPPQAPEQINPLWSGLRAEAAAAAVGAAARRKQVSSVTEASPPTPQRRANPLWLSGRTEQGGQAQSGPGHGPGPDCRPHPRAALALSLPRHPSSEPTVQDHFNPLWRASVDALARGLTSAVPPPPLEPAAAAAVPSADAVTVAAATSFAVAPGVTRALARGRARVAVAARLSALDAAEDAAEEDASTDAAVVLRRGQRGVDLDADAGSGALSHLPPASLRHQASSESSDEDEAAAANAAAAAAARSAPRPRAVLVLSMPVGGAVRGASSRPGPPVPAPIRLRLPAPPLPLTRPSQRGDSVPAVPRASLHRGDSLPTALPPPLQRTRTTVASSSTDAASETGGLDRGAVPVSRTAASAPGHPQSQLPSPSPALRAAGGRSLQAQTQQLNRLLAARVGPSSVLAARHLLVVGDASDGDGDGFMGIASATRTDVPAALARAVRVASVTQLNERTALAAVAQSRSTPAR
jgi:hypothetical protein